ncbi:MAG: TIGR04086 family membrane protein [Lachnospiraceae bacterium]|nr:TIGR04086 family membrane protein [Lachnospiraceae bacterium]
MKKGIRLLQGLFLSYIITGIILVIFAFLLYKMEWGEKSLHMGIIATYIISTVIGGFYVGRKVKTQRLIFGFLFGALYIGVIILVASLLYPNHVLFSKNFLSVVCMCMSGGILGGILS